MMKSTNIPSSVPARLPPDDPTRHLTVTPADEAQQQHFALPQGATHTLLVDGQDTAGRFLLMYSDMPPNGGPPPHRHDFDEAFTILEGELEIVFRGEIRTVRAGDTVNIPANAPHAVNNKTDRRARFFTVCTPAGLDEFFKNVGIPVPTRASRAPNLSQQELDAYHAKFGQFASLARTEML